jgi:hypothetical protein
MKIFSIISSILGILLCFIAMHSLKPTTVGAQILFSIWLSSPFIGALKYSFTKPNKIGLCIGIYSGFIIGAYSFYEIVAEGDAQGAIAIFMLPALVLPIIIVSTACINVKKT